jgi:hypothetical protein
VVTSKVPLDPVSEMLGGQVIPCPVHPTVAVSVVGSGAVTVTVTGTVDGLTVDAGTGTTVETVGGRTDSVIERVWPPALALNVTVRAIGTTCVAI